MKAVLQFAECMLPRLLTEPVESWKTLRVDDEYPHVDRLWREFGELPTPSDVAEGVASYRLFLHKLGPVPAGVESLWHKHRWPSAVRVWRVFDPRETGVGAYLHRRGRRSPTESWCESIPDGGCYVMTDPNEQHSVTIYNAPIYSVMVTGPLYSTGPDAVPLVQERTVKRELGPVPAETVLDILRVFRGLYPL